ncbi:haloacid dehalogenase superfamily, subfamily IA, variant 3 with third motif having DD or ED/beta-phosphoglucomutase family hydrolase [Lutibacter agarilyticus]|uniref:Haloacid dehalogenase superfamily, subfamily IA, variant 3 with third motif having DD or ED/beta-phosphoglucomutase family hydrolase n=1 Tax=Lutibacter agarilyticus TaxID=1109740 RepID=A0A238VZB7_9FLAO|nr:beta-phosphoglucomutase family hydrolase [Lutibacter agarilyticus]SNR39507.1 haloacid dehalogenase superfamily, subfamily IA, variant 3 with third motif having DD or ED/beta-phosphoglucomutase family hydrolase [Lutibacter agarilyticus]
MIEIPKRAKGLIFDLDGTVANTMQSHFEAWRTAVAPFGIDFTPELFLTLTGMPKAATIIKLNESFGTDMNTDEVGKAKAKVYKELVTKTQEIKVVTNVVRKYHGKLPMSIGTGSTQIGAQRTLSILGMKHYFNPIITADDVMNFKPAPDTFLKCAELMGVAPKDCVVFEDGILGIQAAEAVGMMVVDVNDYFEMKFTV